MRIKTDPFTIEITGEMLRASAEEMFITYARTAQSPIIYEVLDLACGPNKTSARPRLSSAEASVEPFGTPSATAKGDKMVKLTVMYNLPPGADHDEFLEWRTGPHQKDNVGLPGLIKTDFYVVQDSREGPAPYRYMTEAYFPDMGTFEKAFYDHDYQAKLQEDLKRIADPLFLISKEVLTDVISNKGANETSGQRRGILAVTEHLETR